MNHDIPSQRSEGAQPGFGAGFLERMRVLAEAQSSSAEALYNLYEREGNSPEFTDALDDIVFDIAFSDPDYAENATKLKNDRIKSDVAAEIAARQKATIEQIRNMVLIEARIPTEEMMSDIEKGQAAVAERLQGTDLSQSDSDEALRKLGILREDGNGGAVFTYPRDLFPESVNAKWDVYIASVQAHVRTGREVAGGAAPREHLAEADKSRKFAHDSVTGDIDKILGFHELPDEEWDFKDTRNLIAKMRDAKFGHQTSEAIITSKALARGMGALGLSVVAKLASANVELPKH